MKIINIHKTIDNRQLADYINEKLNLLFNEQRQSNDISFNAQINNNTVEVYASKIYEGFLYRIKIVGNELHITRSEHYVDDVNSLTVESILNDLFERLADDGKVTLTLEG